MKKNIILPLGLLFAALQMNAQDIYKMEMFSSSDLNGTARYVGMGGAMNALGADLSTMTTNPAAIGLYRRSDISMTGSVLIQPDVESFWDVNKARASFDQIGFVYAAKMEGDLKFINFGFNYHKDRNLKSIFGVNDFMTGGMSQSWQMRDLCFTNKVLDLNVDDDRKMTTPLTRMGYDTYMIDYLRDENGNVVTDENGNLVDYQSQQAESYNYRKAQWGGIQSYDFNLSMNWNDQVYGGLTFGVKNVDVHSGTYYGENIINPADNSLHPYHMTTEEAISGTGYDVKLGLVVRPIEESPFRIGFAVHTPTFYDLNADAYLYMRSPFASEHAEYTEAELPVPDNEYKIRTPWKINLSMATTVERLLALDIEYEFSNYSTAKVSYFDYDDYYENPFSNGNNDRALNNEAKRFMKPVHSFRFGAEARLSQNLYARGGYNYVSAPFKDDAYLNLFTSSSSYYYSTNTDYLNLGETQRATCGLGYKTKHFYADIAYQYQKQQGDLYTFHVPSGKSEINMLKPAKLDLIRHNVMLTFGYKF